MKDLNESGLPSWLNKEFLENSLRKGFKLQKEKNEFKIINACIESATGPGENYASQMFRCRLTVTDDDDGDDVDDVDEKNKKKNKTLNVIVKSIPSGDAKTHLENFMFFEKEIKMLTETLPLLNEILVKGYPKETKFGARCYYHEKSPNHLLIMEDLKEKNYRNADRFTGLDLNHVELVLKTLAKFHAASLALVGNVAHSTDIYHNTFYSNKNLNFVNDFVGAPFEVLSEDVLNWKNHDKIQYYSNKLNKLKKNVVKDFLNLLSDDNDNFKLKVLTHGDAWVNNIMFKYEESTGSTNKPVDIMLVDFQLCCYTSPMVDLHYFIFTSVRNDLKFERIDYFLTTYHKYFVQAVDKLNIPLKISSYDYVTMKKEFESLYLWSMVVTCAIFPHMCVKKEDTLTLDEILKGNKEKLLKLFKNETLRKIIMRAFEFFDEKGIF